MNKILIGGQDYRFEKLNTMDQFHVSRRIAPILPTIAPLFAEVAGGGLAKLVALADAGQLSEIQRGDMDGLAMAAMPLAEALAAMSDDHANYVLHKCLGVVQRKSGKDWATVCRNGSMMFDDIDMGSMLPLVLAVLRVSLGDFINGLVTKAALVDQPE